VKGSVRHLSDAELDELARITPEDVARAEASARQWGSALLNALLDATDERGSSEYREGGERGVNYTGLRDLVF
jgi:hypothetical protein